MFITLLVVLVDVNRSPRGALPLKPTCSKTNHQWNRTQFKCGGARKIFDVPLLFSAVPL